MSKRKTNKEFLEALSVINPSIEVLEEYINNSSKLKCRCKIDGHEWYAYPTNLLRGEGCPKCRGVELSQMFSKSHADFVKQVSLKNKNIEIIDRYKNNKTKIRCRCKVDGYEWYAYPSGLLRGIGCPVCSGHAVMRGVNDIATTYPEHVQYFKNSTDAFLYSAGSNKKVDCICPCCGYEKSIKINHLIHNDFACPKCGDGVSYPNKFIRKFLDQLEIDNFECEWNDVWSKQYHYDNYFCIYDNRYIVEADGGYHFLDGKRGKTLEEQKKTDQIKDKLAKQHGIEVIRIDCRKSNAEYIKK